ncbi:hypothetical protein BH11PSE11_BH11PSE11_27950 [soil metagenome]
MHSPFLHVESEAGWLLDSSNIAISLLPETMQNGAMPMESNPMSLTSIESGPEDQHQVDLLVRAEQVQVVYRQALPAMVISIMVAMLVCRILWEHTERIRLYAWFGAIVLVALWRSVIVFSYRSAAPADLDVLRWERAFVGSLGVSALVWGVGGLLIMPKDSLLHQAVVYFFLTGMSSGSALMYAARTSAVAFTLTAIMIPATIWFLFQGGLIQMGLAFGGCIYLLSTLRSTRVLGGFLQRSFQLAYELKRANEVAEHLARTDMLTGLNNRRAFSELGAALLNLHRRRGDPVAVIMLDIDHFKKINDSRGHAAGDAALQHLSHLLRECQREADVCGRLGGEEFAILLPGAGLDDARMIAEKIRQRVADAPVEFEGKMIPMTASFGVAGVDTPHGEHLLEDMLRQADALLYRAKEGGRNRVECHA